MFLSSVRIYFVLIPTGTLICFDPDFQSGLAATRVQDPKTTCFSKGIKNRGHEILQSWKTKRAACILPKLKKSYISRTGSESEGRLCAAPSSPNDKTLLVQSSICFVHPKRGGRMSPTRLRRSIPQTW